MERFRLFATLRTKIWSLLESWDFSENASTSWDYKQLHDITCLFAIVWQRSEDISSQIRNCQEKDQALGRTSWEADLACGAKTPPLDKTHSIRNALGSTSKSRRDSSPKSAMLHQGTKFHLEWSFLHSRVCPQAKQHGTQFLDHVTSIVSVPIAAFTMSGPFCFASKYDYWLQDGFKSHLE